MSQRVPSPTPLFSIPSDHPLTHDKLNGFCSPKSTKRVGRGAWCLRASLCREGDHYRMGYQRCTHLSFERRQYQGDAPAEQSVLHAAILSHRYS
jgi:hypothetical protein